MTTPWDPVGPAIVPVPRAADGRIVLAVDVSNWLRPDAPANWSRRCARRTAHDEGWPPCVAGGLGNGTGEFTTWSGSRRPAVDTCRGHAFASVQAGVGSLARNSTLSRISSMNASSKEALCGDSSWTATPCRMGREIGDRGGVEAGDLQAGAVRVLTHGGAGVGEQATEPAPVAHPAQVHDGGPSAPEPAKGVEGPTGHFQAHVVKAETAGMLCSNFVSHRPRPASCRRR